MSIPVSDAARAIATSVRDWAARAEPAATTRAQENEPDGWRKHWDDVVALGLTSAALPERLGGAGAGVGELAALLEAAAYELVPGPVVGTALAGLVIASSGGAAAEELVPRLADGDIVGAVALGPVTAEAARSDAGLRVTGSAGLVAGADRDGVLVLAGRVQEAGEVWFVVPSDTAGLTLIDRAPTDFSRSLCEVRLDGVSVPADSVLRVDSGYVRDLAAALAAAEAAGVAAWCLRTAVDYARVREQFGKPIGSFQAVKHLCAEMLCRVEQIAALAWDAAQAFDGDSEDQRRIASAAAGALALDAAVDTAKDCIQVLGGIGFTWEHDAHLYLRRAIALRQLFGGSAGWRRRTADLALAGVHRELHIDLGDRAAEERAEVRANAAAIAALPAEDQRRALAEAGYLAPHWPAPYGLDADAAHQLVIAQELHAAGVVRPDLVIAAWAVPTILSAGTDEQRERFVAPTLRGEITWCQLFSEPNAGSDLASLRTRADRVDGGWRLSGQKVWTSVAHRADWGICLARTDSTAPKHQGISYFLVDMRSPGIDIRPLREITGEAMFNEVFLDDVFVPDDLVVGEVNDGWRLARTTLANERIAMSGGSGIDSELEVVLAGAQRLGVDEATRERLGRLVAESLSGAVLDVRSTLRQLDGRDTTAESSVRKLIGVRHRQRVAETGLELLGADAAAQGEEVHQFLMTRCLTIAGGTTQVLLTLAAERILGLPRN
jgi:alkylation response protein AidB-like acyl-CoA dehydrogenase